ncbi:hypothetical protein DV515_00018057 [Chloebia gouldiae]|uniref:Uncharacterized protein n=1 Tax=Chloebia gouldiae TaxID=44316 RepID=A0A3L8Q8K7_CHLGU|nr:hypothetical protein DV515_00018057 [Chloebia gouldiae]
MRKSVRVRAQCPCLCPCPVSVSVPSVRVRVRAAPGLRGQRWPRSLLRFKICFVKGEGQRGQRDSRGQPQSNPKSMVGITQEIAPTVKKIRDDFWDLFPLFHHLQHIPNPVPTPHQNPQSLQSRVRPQKGAWKSLGAFPGPFQCEEEEWEREFGNLGAGIPPEIKHRGRVTPLGQIGIPQIRPHSQLDFPGVIPWFGELGSVTFIEQSPLNPPLNWGTLTLGDIVGTGGFCGLGSPKSGPAPSWILQGLSRGLGGFRIRSQNPGNLRFPFIYGHPCCALIPGSARLFPSSRPRIPRPTPAWHLGDTAAVWGHFGDFAPVAGAGRGAGGQAPFPAGIIPLVPGLMIPRNPSTHPGARTGPDGFDWIGRIAAALLGPRDLLGPRGPSGAAGTFWGSRDLLGLRGPSGAAGIFGAAGILWGCGTFWGCRDFMGLRDFLGLQGFYGAVGLFGVSGTFWGLRTLWGRRTLWGHQIFSWYSVGLPILESQYQCQAPSLTQNPSDPSFIPDSQFRAGIPCQVPGTVWGSQFDPGIPEPCQPLLGSRNPFDLGVPFDSGFPVLSRLPSPIPVSQFDPGFPIPSRFPSLIPVSQCDPGFPAPSRFPSLIPVSHPIPVSRRSRCQPPAVPAAPGAGRAPGVPEPPRGPGRGRGRRLRCPNRALHPRSPVPPLPPAPLAPAAVPDPRGAGGRPRCGGGGGAGTGAGPGSGRGGGRGGASRAATAAAAELCSFTGGGESPGARRSRSRRTRSRTGTGLRAAAGPGERRGRTGAAPPPSSSSSSSSSSPPPPSSRCRGAQEPPGAGAAPHAAGARGGDAPRPGPAAAAAANFPRGREPAGGGGGGERQIPEGATPKKKKPKKEKLPQKAALLPASDSSVKLTELGVGKQREGKNREGKNREERTGEEPGGENREEKNREEKIREEENREEKNREEKNREQNQRREQNREQKQPREEEKHREEHREQQQHRQAPLDAALSPRGPAEPWPWWPALGANRTAAEPPAPEAAAAAERRRRRPPHGEEERPGAGADCVVCGDKSSGKHYGLLQAQHPQEPQLHLQVTAATPRRHRVGSGDTGGGAAGQHRGNTGRGPGEHREGSGDAAGGIPVGDELGTNQWLPVRHEPPPSANWGSPSTNQTGEGLPVRMRRPQCSSKP